MRDRPSSSIPPKCRLRALAAALGLTLLPALAHAQQPLPPLPPDPAPVPGWQSPSPYAPTPSPPPTAYTYLPPSYGNYGPPVAQGPKRIDYVEGEPPPDGYHLYTRSHRGLIIGGAVTFGVTYSMTLLAGTIASAVRSADDNDADAATPLFLPVVGPFIAIYTLHSDTEGTSYLLMDGALQLAGAAMLIAGLNTEQRFWVRNDVAGLQLKMAPVMLNQQSTGMGLSGRF